MIGELHAPFDNEDKATRHALLFKDNEFNVTKFGSAKNSNVQGTSCDWVNDGSIIFVWHRGLHCQACVSKSNQKFCNERNHHAIRQVSSDVCPRKFKINSTCPVCMKTWSENSVHCDL